MASNTIDALSPEQLRDLELRAQTVHPDEPVGSARQALALIHQIRDLDGRTISYQHQIGAVRALARSWIGDRDVFTAAAGRLVLAALDGPTTSAASRG